MTEEKKSKSEGLIKDAYELILRELQTVLSLFYLMLVGIGMLFTHYKYDAFDINIFEYADIFDFLIAPFQDYRIVVVSFFTLIIPTGMIILDSWWSNNYPKSYSKINFGWDKKWWYDYYRYTAFFGLLIYFLFEGARGYGQFKANDINAAPVMEVVFADKGRIVGNEIGKTKEILFLMVEDRVRIIPLTSMVKEVRLLKQESMSDIKEAFDGAAKDYANKYWSVDAYSDQLDKWAKLLPTEGKVLDLGCGPGNYADHVLKKRPDLKWRGIDFSPAMIEIANDSVPEGNFEVGDVTDKAVFEGSYQGVMISFVTPYIDKKSTIRMLLRSYDQLDPGGQVYLGTIVGDKDEIKAQSPSDGESVSLLTYYRRVETYEDWLTDCGFSIVDVKTLTVNYGDESMDEAIILAEKKKE